MQINTNTIAVMLEVYVAKYNFLCYIEINDFVL